MKFIYYAIYTTFLFLSLVSCRKKIPIDSSTVITDSIAISDVSKNSIAEKIHIESLQEIIYGDTVWVYPFGNQVWCDTLTNEGIEVYITTWVDTTDYLIDTVKSAKGNRIVIGFNHNYSLEFRKDEQFWFNLNFNKKKDLSSILYGTDLWRESNLNIVNNVIYNKKAKCVIIEMSFNSNDQFNSMFYMVAGDNGLIQHLGTISSWGGGGPDGTPFLTDDGKMYITCNEVYNFISGTAINLTEYASIAQIISGVKNTTEYIQIHALRYLANNNFLVVFNRFHNKPRFNALILNTDSLLIDQFGYYGLVEDIDAILLFEGIDKLNKWFLYDTEREVLISIQNDTLPSVEETGLYEMIELGKYIKLSPDFNSLNFGFYSTYEFYMSPGDSTVYYSIDNVN